MKPNDSLKSPEDAVSAALAVVLLLMMPLWGGTAMFLGVTALATIYVWIFRKRFHDGGWAKAGVRFAVAAIVGVIIALALAWWHGHGG